jgi:hypothetical protein
MATELERKTIADANLDCLEATLRGIGYDLSRYGEFLDIAFGPGEGMTGLSIIADIVSEEDYVCKSANMTIAKTASCDHVIVWLQRG